VITTRALMLFVAAITGAPDAGSHNVASPRAPSAEAQPAPTPGLIVSPVSLTIRDGVRTGSIEIRNPGTERKRFEVAAVSWRQDRDGQPRLSPTTDVFFHPALLDIPPGGKGIVRAGVKSGGAPTERTYRLIVTELEPPPRAGGAGIAALTMLTRLSVPIFVEPKSPRSEPAVDALRVEARKIAFSLVNRGNSHYVAKRLSVRGVDEVGEALFEIARDGWYVLPGDPSDYELDFPAVACTRLRAIEVEVETSAAQTSARLELPGGCAI
jgi:fimbrial chaperone protein